MPFEEGDSVVLEDKHSEHDGETGTVTQVMETMFGDANYTVSFEDGEEAGIPEDNLEAAEEPDEAEAAESSEDDAAADDDVDDA